MQFTRERAHFQYLLGRFAVLPRFTGTGGLGSSAAGWRRGGLGSWAVGGGMETGLGWELSGEMETRKGEKGRRQVHHNNHPAVGKLDHHRDIQYRQYTESR